MENNRKEYVVRCAVFTAIVTIAIIGFYIWMTNNSSAYDASKGYWVGIITAVVFVLCQVAYLYRTLRIPDDRAESIERKANAKIWAKIAAAAFGGALVLSGLIMTSIGDLLGLAVGGALYGVITYFVSLPLARILSPKKYIPWRTEEGYQAYLRREEQRRREAAAKAARYSQYSQSHSTYSQPPSSPEPAQSTTSASSVRGRIYRAGFNGSELGYYTSDTVYKANGFSDSKLGTYQSGRIDDDSGVWSAHTVGRYEWSSTYGGYLIYEGDSKTNFIGRVLRNGDIQAAKQPHGVTEIVLQGTEYTTIGRFTGDPEGAAAAAYLLLFR